MCSSDLLDWVLTNRTLVQPAIRVVNMSLGRAGSVNDNPLLRDTVADLDAGVLSFGSGIDYCLVLIIITGLRQARYKIDGCDQYD